EKIQETIEKIEVPYSIPTNWQWLKMQQLNELIMGQSPKGNAVTEFETSNSIEFHQGKSDFTSDILGRSSKYTTQVTKFVSAPSIVMSVRAPVGDVNLLNHNIVIGRGLAAITPYRPMSRNFEYLYLKTLKLDLERKATGSTFKAITGQILQNTLVLLPPLEEQERIVTQVEKFYSQIAQLPR
ncbi:MAG: restriction endonuclease subunit S, partial [Streptococcaceae bacterium]|nr:restriction endonuclease subunit S [Streptococcaceae bacterium]